MVFTRLDDSEKHAFFELLDELSITHTLSHLKSPKALTYTHTHTDTSPHVQISSHHKQIPP